MSAPSSPWTLEDLKAVIARHWGYNTFRPLQEPAMKAVLDGRDALVVLPTGGGKSLCYQAPAVLRGDTTVVVSPLISLMKDQVDSLQACGVPAIQIDSSQSPEERSAYETDVAQGAVRLLFASPERLVLPGFQRLLQQIKVKTFAIDEGHCISHWGHDFRPEYRQLSQLKTLFPEASVHAYTATATERVRRDIIEQLALKDPVVLVGNFDRPNLTYRILPLLDLKTQVAEVLERHKGEAGIIYCIRRRDVDDLTMTLQQAGYQAMPYHAGLTPEQRRKTQDAFAAEECNLVVATVAFGMGIDRSNIRFVLHTGMPKSVEHYQQETGRAGRDGLEAECVLFHSGADVMTWKFIIEKSAGEPGVDPSYLASAMEHLNHMDRYCKVAVCRHRALVEYFGQSYSAPSCAACDLCLGDAEPVPDAPVLAQKILSCVARVKESFGVKHVISVLRGENTETIRKRGHDRLTTYGLLKEHGKAELRDWIYQLIGQNVLVQQGDEYPVLKLNPDSWEVMKGQKAVRLVQQTRQTREEGPARSRADTASWEGVDRELFEALRSERRQLAEQREVPPYVIFSDATLRELARVRPSSLARMRLVYGIGDAKLKDFGPRFLQIVKQHCSSRDLGHDQKVEPPRLFDEPKNPVRINLQRELAFKLFRDEAVLVDVVHQTGRSPSTVVGFLCDYILAEKPASVSPWVADEVYHQVEAAARKVGTDRLKPIFLALNEKISYDDIRIVVVHMQALGK